MLSHCCIIRSSKALPIALATSLARGYGLAMPSTQQRRSNDILETLLAFANISVVNMCDFAPSGSMHPISARKHGISPLILLTERTNSIMWEKRLIPPRGAC